MTRLIDADTLKDEVMKIWAYIQCVTGDDVMDAVMTDIKNAPTVDAVQVIRCEKCAHNCGEYDGYICCDKTQEISVLHSKDWFCKDGKRKEE